MTARTAHARSAIDSQLTAKDSTDAELKNLGWRPDTWAHERSRARDSLPRPLDRDDASAACARADPPSDVQPLRAAVRTPRARRDRVLVRAGLTGLRPARTCTRSGRRDEGCAHPPSNTAIRSGRRA